MVKLLDLIELDKGEARKFRLNDRHGDTKGLRNRLEQTRGASNSFCTQVDNAPCAYQMAVANGQPEKECYVKEASVKKLISEEYAKRPNTRHNAPSIVARLMGIDTLSVDTKPSAKQVEKKNGIGKRNPPKEERLRNKDVNSFNKPKHREHPQEEELQKFKMEFEAWQMAKFKECSEFVEVGTKTDLFLAQQRLNKEKLLLYGNSTNMVTAKPVELKGHGLTEYPHEIGLLKFPKVKNDFLPAAQKIVILRPLHDRTGNNEESWASSPGISEEGSSIEDFLHEVKKRLKCEMKAKRSKSSISENSYTEKPSDAKKIARCIAQQARERVTRDVGMTLPQSESSRSRISGIQCDRKGSPEFINRDTRRFLTEGLRNKEKNKTEVTGYNSSKASHWEDMKDEPDMPRKYFRQEQEKSLVRSFSAPASRTSFGKLLLEDRQLTGARITRKCEDSENVMINIKKWRNEKFNLKEKVSSFNYSFVLKGRIFGKKNQTPEESHGDKQNDMKVVLTTPDVVSKLDETHDNSAEVPPSPASVCSTTNEELSGQAEYCSPSSALDDSDMPRVFKEISSNLNELRRQLNHLETYDSEETMSDEERFEEETLEIDNPAEAFVRDLLVASGLYDGSSDMHLSKWDPLGKPISNRVFEEVEEWSSSDRLDKLNHKLLCDFLNEVLPGVLAGAPSTVSSFMKRSVGSTTRPPRGKKLLDCVSEIARVYVDMSSKSLENILAQDLKCAAWDGLVDEDVNALGKYIEYQIIGDLIHDMVNDMQL